MAINRLNPDYPDAGTVQLIPSSVAVGSGSATTNGNGTVDFSGASSVSLNGVFSSIYKSYKIIVDCLPSTNLDLNMRVRTSGTDNTTSNYNRQFLVGNATTATSGRSASQSVWALNLGASAHRQLFDMTISNPFDALQTGVFVNSSYNYNDTTNLIVGINNYSFSSTTSFDGFTLYTSTGTLTGYVAVYGLRN